MTHFRQIVHRLFPGVPAPLTLSLQRQQLLPNLFAGLITALVMVIYSISCAALIFSGDLAPLLPQGVHIALISSVLAAILMALLSSQPFTAAGCDPRTAVLMGGMAATIAQQLQVRGNGSNLLPTVWVAIALTSLLTGLVLFLLGRLHLGQLARFIPYPVMGGFLAGTGWLIARSSFKIMVDIPLDLVHLPQLVQGGALIQWIPGAAFALLLLGISNRYQHYLVIPSLLVGGIVVFHLLQQGLSWLAIPVVPDWFFQPGPSSNTQSGWSFMTLGQADWGIILEQASAMVAVVIVVVITTLLQTTGLEIATQKDIKLDQELQANGVVNGIAGCFGGLVTNVSVNRSLLSYRAGANHPLSGLFAGLLCGVVLLFGNSFLTYFPKPIFGGMLLFLGLTLLHEWLYVAWFKLPRLDYILIIVILAIVAVWNFMVGVGAGVLIACLLFIINYSRSRSVRYALSGVGYRSNVGRSLQQQRFLQQEGEQIYLLALQGYIFFGTANALLAQVSQRLKDPDLSELRFLVLDFRLVNGLDSSAVLSFVKMRKLAQSHNFILMFTDLNAEIQHQLIQGRGFDSEDTHCQQAADLDRGMEWCEDQLLELAQWRRRRYVPLSLQLNDLFSDTHQIEVFIDYLEEIEVPAGHILFRQGDRPDAIYLIEAGQVSLLIELNDHLDRRIQTLGDGMIVGRIAGNRTTVHSVMAIADRATTLHRLSEVAFHKMQIHHPQAAIAFLEAFIDLLSERNLNASKEIKELLQ